MSMLAQRRSMLDEPIDEVYVIYGKAGTGKTVLASTFPKTKDKPLLYLDIKEGGSASIEPEMADNIEYVAIETFAEFESVLEDLLRGGYTDEQGQFVPVAFSTVVMDSLSQLETTIKDGLKSASGKSQMSIQLWGQTKDSSEMVYNLMRQIHRATKAIVVGIAHEKTDSVAENSNLTVIIPQLMNSVAYSLCAKASYVWYTNVESETSIGTNGQVSERAAFYTYIDTAPHLLSKCRKPQSFQVPLKIENLTYSAFNRGVLAPVRQLRAKAKGTTTAQPTTTKTNTKTK